MLIPTKTHPINCFELTLTFTPKYEILELSQPLNRFLQGEDYLAVGADFRSFIYAEDIPVFTDYLQRVGTGVKGAGNCELRLLQGSYQMVWHMISVEPVTTDTGAVVYLGYLLDISQLKQVQEALEHSVAMREAIEAALPSGVEMSGESGIKTYVNKAFCAMTGFSEAELLGKIPPYAYWPPEEYENILAQFNRSMLAYGPVSTELTFMRKNGERFPVRVHASSVQLNGKRLGVIASFDDITRERQAEQRIRQSEERFALLFENVSSALLFVDANGTVLEANAAAKALLGIKPEDMNQLQLPCTECYLVSSQGKRLALAEYPHIKVTKLQTGTEPLLCGIRKQTVTVWVRITATRFPVTTAAGTELVLLEIQDATTEVNALQAAANAKAVTSALTAAGGDLITVIEADGSVALSNSGLPELRAELLTAGKRKISIVPSADNPLYKLFTNCRTGSGDGGIVFCRKPKDSETRWYECRAELVGATNPEKPKVVLITRDVTSTTTNMPNPRKTEKLLKLLFDQGREGFFIMQCSTPVLLTDGNQAELRILYDALALTEWNAVVPRLCRIDGNQLMGAGTDVMLKKFSATPDLLFAELLKQRFLRFQTTIERMDDTDFRAEVELNVLINEAGEVEGISGVIRDITEESAVAEALAESELKFRTIAERLPDILYHTDASAKLLYLSPAVKQITGYSPEQFAGAPFSALLSPGTKQAALKQLKADIQSGVSAALLPAELIHKDGHTVPAEVSASTIFRDGKPAGSIGIIRDVAQQRMQERALLNLKDFYEELLNALPMQIAVTDARMRHTFVNPAAIRKRDLRKFILGKDILEYFMFREYDRQVALERIRIMNHVLETRQPYTYEETLETKKGRFTHLRYTIPLLGSDGNVKSFLHVGLDITMMKEMEAELQKREARFRELFTQMPDGFILLDIIFNKQAAAEDFIILDYNSRFAQLMGIEPVAGVGSRLSKVFAGHEESWFQFMRDVANSGITRRTEGYSSVRGRHFSILAYITQGGKLAIIVRDVTQERIQKEKIYQLSTVVEQSPVGILITTVSSVVLYANNYFCESNQTTQAGVLGARYDALLKGQVQAGVLAAITAARKNQELWNGELRFTRADGSAQWVSAIIMPIAISESAPVNYVWIFTDITERKLMLQDLTAAKERAEVMNKLKSSFLANMSHELRTPLIGILGFSEILCEAQSDPELQQMAETINSSGHRLLTTLNQILDLSRVEANRQDIYLGTHDIGAIVRDVQRLFSKVAAGKNLALRAEVPELPLLRVTDERLLRSVLTNLVDNAIKFTDAGAVTITLRQAPDAAGGEYCLDIADTGIGIPADACELIFEEFRQASEGLGRAFEGTGVGLSIARKFVTMLGGNITLNSTPGKGSVFTVTLPGYSKEHGTVHAG